MTRLLRDMGKPAGAPGHVFADTVVPLDAECARRRLWLAVAAAGKDVGVSDALEFPLVVAVRRGHGLHKRVQARLSAPLARGRNHVAALRWDPAGFLASCYPRLDGQLTLTAINDTTCLLTFTGDYRPPLGALGRADDAAGLSRVAAASARAVTDQFARRLTSRSLTDPKEVPR